MQRFLILLTWVSFLLCGWVQTCIFRSQQWTVLTDNGSLDYPYGRARISTRELHLILIRCCLGALGLKKKRKKRRISGLFLPGLVLDKGTSHEFPITESIFFFLHREKKPSLLFVFGAAAQEFSGGFDAIAAFSGIVNERFSVLVGFCSKPAHRFLYSGNPRCGNVFTPQGGSLDSLELTSRWKQNWVSDQSEESSSPIQAFSFACNRNVNETFCKQKVSSVSERMLTGKVCLLIIINMFLIN